MHWIQSRGLLLSACTSESVLRGDEECFTTLQLQPGHNISPSPEQKNLGSDSHELCLHGRPPVWMSFTFTLVFLENTVIPTSGKRLSCRQKKRGKQRRGRSETAQSFRWQRSTRTEHKKKSTVWVMSGLKDWTCSEESSVQRLCRRFGEEYFSAEKHHEW